VETYDPHSPAESHVSSPAASVAASPGVQATRPPPPVMPRLNEPAPDFEAHTTDGVRRLSDYRGKWLLLFSHPADFTPVCTTEFIAFARAKPQFDMLNTELLGLSIDSTFAHLAWIRSIRDKFDVEIPFPVIDDLSMQVAHAYGMIHPGSSDTSAVRATFIIDPEGFLRAIMYYPTSNGRSVPELVRLMKALQTADTHRVATPEGWEEGDPVLLPPPTTFEQADARANGSDDCTDWYFCTRTL